MNRILRFTALALLLAATAHAYMLDIPLDKNAAEADAVVRGTVVSRSSHWLEDGPHIIVTDVTVRITENWKGSLAEGRTVTLRVNGGEVGEMGMRQEHQAVFSDDEDVVLFLKASSSARWSMSYDEQGKFRVKENHVVGSKGDAGTLAVFRGAVKQMIQAAPKPTDR